MSEKARRLTKIAQAINARVFAEAPYRHPTKISKRINKTLERYRAAAQEILRRDQKITYVGLSKQLGLKLDTVIVYLRHHRYLAKEFGIKIRAPRPKQA